MPAVARVSQVGAGKPECHPNTGTLTTCYLQVWYTRGKQEQGAEPGLKPWLSSDVGYKCPWWHGNYDAQHLS